MSSTQAEAGLRSIMEASGIDYTRERYIAFNWAGIDLSEWSAEDEGELPEDLQDWSLFKVEGNRLTYIGPPIES